MNIINTYIPKSEIEPFRKFAAKVQKRVPDMRMSIGVEIDKLYIHTETFDGRRVGEVKEWHPVYPVTVEMPEDCGWQLLATYKDGDFYPADMSKKLLFKNPAHGPDYGRCDVCGHKCKSSYVVYNPATEEELQVGCECAKKFGLRTIEWISKFTGELNRIYKINGISCSDYAEDGRLPIWRNPDTFAFAAIPSIDLICAAKAYYDKNPVWIKGYYEDRNYVKSKSNEEIQWMVGNKKFKCDEDYAKIVFAATFAIADSSEFTNEMKRLAADYYCKPADACYAFFMVKNHEDSIMAAETGLDKIQKGSQALVRGEVICTESRDSFYGTMTIYTIRTDKGFIAKRAGKLPITQIDGISRVECYAMIKDIIHNEIILDRAVKHAKKGVDIAEL